MKKFLFSTIVLFAFAPVAIGYCQNIDYNVYGQASQREQVIRAYYVNDGRLYMIKIKIVGNKVIQYSTEKNNGSDLWLSAGDADIMRTQYQYDGELAQEFENKACISTMFARVLWIYF